MIFKHLIPIKKRTPSHSIYKRKPVTETMNPPLLLICKERTCNGSLTSLEVK